MKAQLLRIEDHNVFTTSSGTRFEFLSKMPGCTQSVDAGTYYYKA